MIIGMEDADKYLTSATPHLVRLSDQVMIAYLAGFSKADIISQLTSVNITETTVALAINLGNRKLLRRFQ